MIDSLPMYRARQRFASVGLANLDSVCGEQLARLAPQIPRGGRVAIAAGSRGIRDHVSVLRHVAAMVRQAGAEPFIVPAMGSHGGATPDGQRDLLTSVGITVESVGAAVRSSMETVELAAHGCECRVFMDKLAWESDGVILVNRIKPHTDFHGEFESGLVKMAVIGLGKHAQALEIHRLGVRGLRSVVPMAARAVFATGKVIGGVGIVEDAYDRTMAVRALGPREIVEQEPVLLGLARANMPRLPLEHIDVLIVDRIGKDISGVGMDPNIIGRMAIRGEAEPDSPRIGAIVARRLSAASHGNALGVGLADVITRELYDAIDYATMYENVYASTFLERAKVPVVAKNDREALAYALRAAWLPDIATARVVRIRDTLDLATVYLSAGAARAARESAWVEIDAGAEEHLGPDADLRECFT